MRLPGRVEKGDRLTCEQYARGHGVTVQQFVPVIDAGLVRAQIVQTGKRRIRLVDEHEADEDIAKLPSCPHPGCERRVFPPKVACCGPHARGLQERGKPKSAEVRGKMAAGKRGKPRPDVRERVEAMHADKKQRRQWHLALLQGRAAGVRTTAKRSDAIDPLKIRNAKNRLNALRDDAHRPRNADRDWYDVAVRKVLEFHGKNKKLGEPTLARIATRALRDSGDLGPDDPDLTRYFARQALGRG